MNENVLQHFRKDEHPFIDTVNGWIEKVESQYAPFLSDFLDPRQEYIVETLIRQRGDLQFQFYGGYEAAERKRVLLYPDYYVPTVEDYEIKLFEIVYPIKFGHLSHGKVLGTLLSTGLKREYFGDIISDGERWQIFLEESSFNFVVSQVDKIDNLSVRLELRNYTDIILPKDNWTFEHITSSSMRLDTLVSSVYAISRQRSKQLIESGKVKVNWVTNQRSDFVLDILDIVSVRKYGRIQIREIEGKTKKDKYRLYLGVLRK